MSIYLAVNRRLYAGKQREIRGEGRENVRGGTSNRVRSRHLGDAVVVESLRGVIRFSVNDWK